MSNKQITNNNQKDISIRLYENTVHDFLYCGKLFNQSERRVVQVIDILQLSASELQNIELRRSKKAIPGGISFESDILRIGDISLDLDSLRILLKMDGTKKLSQISNATGTDSSLLKVTLHKLMNFGLVELVGNEATVLDESFLQAL